MSIRLPAEWEPQSAIQFTFPHEDSDWQPLLDRLFRVLHESLKRLHAFKKP
jgi:agmatine deiminase